MFQLFIYIGCGFILISGVALGAWTTPEQQRRNFNSEQPSDKRMRNKVATWSFLLALVCLAIAGLINWLD
ncbi:DUF5316 family protein [Paenibacillus glycanilyticus]|uniref:Uncharacterized protein n=1 Tax=Paenibacillus glycanilyticus TaxID=126569 RepID=A0ABQ6NM44_9BACL|nr:DUF5316 family protein [Paenibacillus glycanilyticus]GMK45595.1 hypothetical protein PghCCS26_27230 [Paenibacillus glycanilyticus]